jgi:hypothetical protein
MEQVMVYQYKGSLTLEVETSLEQQMELIRAAEQRSWEAAEEARLEARRIARQNQALRDQLADQRRKKRNAQTQARRLRERLGEVLATIPEPEPEPDTVHGGREGLEAACREVAAFEARRRQERKAA